MEKIHLEKYLDKEIFAEFLKELQGQRAEEEERRKEREKQRVSFASRNWTFRKYHGVQKIQPLKFDNGIMFFQMKKKLMVDKENERRRLALNASITANSDIFNEDTDSDTPVAG